MSKFIKAIVWIVLVLILVGGIGLIIKYTNGFTDDFKTFYVTIDDKDILSSASDFVFGYDSEMKVEVHYVFEKVTNDTKSYSVKVVPNKVEGNDFDFTLDGQAYSFQEESDLTAGFEIVKGATSFTIKPKGELQEILQARYPNNTVEVDGASCYENMFKLVVTSYNEQASVSITFMLYDGVYKITLDKEEIIF